jgi:hypothetical protein
MKTITTIILFFFVFGTILLAGCTQSSNVPSQMSNPIPSEVQGSKTTIVPGQQPATPIPTASSIHATSWNGNLATVNQFYFADCTHKIDTTNMEKLQGMSVRCEDGSEAPYVLRPGMSSPSYGSTPTAPQYTDKIMQNDPIIGTYVFDPSQFKSVDVERLDYFSTLGSSEYDHTVVPLDISPDIKWTFRDDGILLFNQNTITSSDDSLRSAWKKSNGVFLRNGTWKKIESENEVNKYQITRKTFGYPAHEYTVIYDKNGVRLTQPNSLNMTKID